MARFEAVIGHSEDWESAVWAGHDDDPREAALSAAHEWVMSYLDDLPGEWPVVVYEDARYEYRADIGEDVVAGWARRGACVASLAPCGPRQVHVVITKIEWEVPDVG